MDLIWFANLSANYQNGNVGGLLVCFVGELG